MRGKKTTESMPFRREQMKLGLGGKKTPRADGLDESSKHPLVGKNSLWRTTRFGSGGKGDQEEFIVIKSTQATTFVSERGP